MVVDQVPSICWVAEEIEFMKLEQPRFYSHLIFQVELFNLNDRVPCGTADQLKFHYEQELGFAERLFKSTIYPIWDYYLKDFI